jgi:hypothetical protein
VTGDDHARLGEDAERLVTWIANEAFMRLDPAAPDAGDPSAPPRRCAALVLDPARGAFACSIYSTRPQVCRDLARGSPACLGELAVKGERPKRSLTVLATARDP